MSKLALQYFSDLVQMNNWAGNYQIYIASVESPKFKLIEGIQQQVALPIQQLTIQDEEVLLLHEASTFILFTYPNEYQILLNLYDYRMERQAELVVLYHYMYPYYTKAAVERQKYKLEKVIESTGRASSILDPDEIYNNILGYALDVIPKCDIGTLWWFEEERNRLICKAFAGNILRGIRQMAFKKGEGPIGYTFETGQPILYHQNEPEIWSSFGAISEENNQFWDTSYVFTEEVKSFLTCSIKINDKVEGVLFLCQLTNTNKLTAEDLQLLEGFSSQLGIAIRNARQYSKIKKLNEALLRRDEIHNTLTQFSMQNMGMSKVIEEMNKIIDRDLIFVNLLENEVSPALRYLPNQLSFIELNEILHSVDRPNYKLKKSGYTTHIAYPIRFEQMVLGCIIVEMKTKMTQLDEIVIEQGHSVLALELSRKQRSMEFYHKKQRDLFMEFINAGEQPVILQKAQELKIQPHEPYMIVLIQIMEDISPQEMEVYIHKLTTQIRQLLFTSKTVLFAQQTTVTIVARANKVEEKLLRKELQKICLDWQQKMDISLSCGIGLIYSDVSLLKKSYDEAKTVLSYLNNRQLTGVMNYKEIGINRLFMKQGKQDIHQFIQEVFAPLETAQYVNNELSETLATYFAENRSAAKTAKVLHIHINTLYQRLKKIEEVLQISLEDTEHVLKLQLACYLKQSYM